LIPKPKLIREAKGLEGELKAPLHHLKVNASYGDSLLEL